VLFFPELAKRQLEMLAERQAEDGRIPHAFAGNFDQTTVYYDDDYLKFILQVYRDWIWTGDEAYLRRMWPRLRKVLEACRRLDLDGDGIPDVRGHNHDYDQWMMFGLGIYAAGHWPAALRMMARMGLAVGDDEHCARWEDEARHAADRIDADLWTGKWYGLYWDRKSGLRSRALLANNLCGQWYERMLGLPPSLPAEHVRENLRSVFELNRHPAVGLRCGWLPPQERRRIGTRDWHWRVCWLGTEYAVASHMIYEGLVEEGLTVCREGHRRHDRWGLRYNHFECGEHYTRALSVWSVLLAVQGFGWDAVQKALTFRPCVASDDHRSVLVLPTCWGIVQQRLQSKGCRWSLRLVEGSLTLRALHLVRAIKTLHLDGRQITFSSRDNWARLDEDLVIQAGQRVTATFEAEDGEPPTFNGFDKPEAER